MRTSAQLAFAAPYTGGVAFGLYDCTYANNSSLQDPTVATRVVTLAPGGTATVWYSTASGDWEWKNGVSEVTAANRPDPDSTPNNANPSEDDYLKFQVNVPG